MGLFKKKVDPIAARSQALQAEIKQLESQIQKLSVKAQKEAEAKPRLRSTTPPEGKVQHNAPAEPVFEQVDVDRIKTQPEIEATPEHYNDLGVRKYDLIALIKRIQNHFRGPPTNNPKLITYLAAGSIQGLRPLRYESRVARNRVIALCIVLLLFLWGIFALLFHKS